MSTADSLRNLFSESEQSRFTRTFKAQEVAPEKLQPVISTEDSTTRKKKEKKRKRIDTQESISPSQNRALSTKTLFIGNVPISENIKSIAKIFQQYGVVESVRLRSVPIAGVKVDDAGNQDLVRKVCVNSKMFGEQKGSFNAYVVFKEESSVEAALVANNMVIGERHIRVDRDAPSLFDHKLTLFIGALPHYADEEELREHFAKVLPNGHNDIVGVRLIRDPSTLVGKGIGYLQVRDKDAVTKALSLHQVPFKKRWELRVTLCGKRTKRTEQRKTENAEDGPTADGVSNNNPVAKKQKIDKKDNKKGNPAMRRINLKSANTKSKYLKERSKTKKVAGKKGKRLGGVVKRAMKAASAGGSGR